MTALRRLLILLPLLLIGAIVAPASAGAAEQTFTYTKEISVSGYEVRQGISPGIENPDISGHITKMEVDIVDAPAGGDPVPISRLMLHHIVFLNVNERDRTCDGFRDFGGNFSYAGLDPERFYAAGEERAKLFLPPGYGYQHNASDYWAMTYMVMNHRKEADTAWIQWKVTVDDDPAIEAVHPYWLDARNCRADPIYNVPGTGRPGSTAVEKTPFTMPESGRIIGAGGHVHGGARVLRLVQPQCGSRQLGYSAPTWGMPDHPFYNVRPILHEPGPINMSAFGTSTGIPVAAGETIQLNSIYDNADPHTRVMGIMVVYVAPDPTVTAQCSPLPGDVVNVGTNQPGRTGIVPFRIPLTGIGSDGNATTISKPPGPNLRLRSGAKIGVDDRFFEKPNVVVKRGARLNWIFKGSELHNLTLANGPVGIGSPNLDADRRYSRSFGRNGTYNMFCALHPVQMHQRVIVKPKRKRH